MANTSIMAAFERFWTHVLAKINVQKLEFDASMNAINDEVSDHIEDTVIHMTSSQKNQLSAAYTHVDNESVHVTAELKDKLNGIEEGATKTIIDSVLSSTSSNPVENKAVQSAIQVLEDKKADKDELPTKTSDLTNDSGFITSSVVTNHNIAIDAHNDIRLLVSDISTKLNNFLNIDDATKDQLSEIIALIEINADDIESITSGKVNVSDIVDNLTTNVSNKTLSAAQGVIIKSLIDTLQNEVDTHEHNYAGSSTPGGSATSAITLTGLTSTISELNLVQGVSSNIQDQFNSEISARELGDENTLSDAKTYTDERIADTLKSNYDLWLSLGNTGTPSDFLEWLKGDSAYEIWASQEENIGKTEEEFLASLETVTENDLSQVLTDANAYTDEKLANFSGGATDFADMTATDTSGFLGTANVSVNAQNLSDKITERILELENSLINKVNTSDLGDQVTFTLSGTTLTITTK